MKKNKILKKTAWFIGILLLIVGILFGIAQFKISKAYDVENKPYKNYIGYIDQENALLNNEYQLCNNGELYHTYNGAGLKAYAGTKKKFRDKITAKFNSNKYTDSGYLNFRFLVNCEGKAGWFEIIQMNLDLEEYPLNENMVTQLLELTAEPNNWNIISYKNLARNYYMYVSYRIENGKITEIIP